MILEAAVRKKEDEGERLQLEIWRLKEFWKRTEFSFNIVSKQCDCSLRNCGGVLSPVQESKELEVFEASSHQGREYLASDPGLPSLGPMLSNFAYAGAAKSQVLTILDGGTSQFATSMSRHVDAASNMRIGQLVNGTSVEKAKTMDKIISYLKDGPGISVPGIDQGDDSLEDVMQFIEADATAENTSHHNPQTTSDDESNYDDPVQSFGYSLSAEQN